ncbi:hypothetical protein PENSPDRAFT_327295 [Peniophora sp. CONT]|nr:hypothetical protein PENSPDRAFT_327295 [Peniophora sp. CONT]
METGYGTLHMPARMGLSGGELVESTEKQGRLTGLPYTLCSPPTPRLRPDTAEHATGNPTSGFLTPQDTSLCTTIGLVPSYTCTKCPCL